MQIGDRVRVIKEKRPRADGLSTVGRTGTIRAHDSSGNGAGGLRWDVALDQPVPTHPTPQRALWFYARELEVTP